MNFPICDIAPVKRNPFTFFITKQGGKGKIVVDHTVVIHAATKREAIERVRSRDMYGSSVTFQVEEGDKTVHPHTLGNANPIFWNQLRASLQA